MKIAVFKLDGRYFGINLEYITEFIVLKNLRDRKSFPKWVDGSIKHRKNILPLLRLYKALKLSLPEREIGIVSKFNNSPVVFSIPKIIGLYDLDVKRDFGFPITKYFEGAGIFNDAPMIIINPIKLYGKKIEKLGK